MLFTQREESLLYDIKYLSFLSNDASHMAGRIGLPISGRLKAPTREFCNFMRRPESQQGQPLQP